MKILVVNAGSSSLKYQVIDMTDESMLVKGNCERIGLDGSKIVQKLPDGTTYKEELPLPTHAEAFAAVVKYLTDPQKGVISSMSEISAVGHRVVQGGAIFKQSCLVTDQVIADIESLNELAPLHNPAHVLGLKACKAVVGDQVPQVVVFDTSFHSTMPPKAYMFGLPYDYYEKYQVRKYGFHGTSHRYVSNRCAQMLGKPIEELKMITCHLGNGCSISAIDGGKVIDTSMGLTPLDGFMMGTRSGAVDPSAVLYVMEKEGFTPEEMSEVLNKKSGVYGISGGLNDNRDILAAIDKGDERAKLANDMQIYEVQKLIGSYYVALGGADVIVFTGGIGENGYEFRESVCDGLGCFGVKTNFEFDKTCHGVEADISAPDSKVRIMVIPTNEELVIARDTYALVQHQ